LEYASKELLADKQFVLDTVKSNGRALGYASKELRADREVVLEAVKSKAIALRCASKELRADREVILAAVKSDGNLLQILPKELQADKEVVLAAVKSNGYALQYASRELQADREVVALKSSGSSFNQSVKMKSTEETKKESPKQKKSPGNFFGNMDSGPRKLGSAFSVAEYQVAVTKEASLKGEVYKRIDGEKGKI
jgi:hypothetical protein